MGGNSALIGIAPWEACWAASASGMIRIAGYAAKTQAWKGMQGISNSKKLVGGQGVPGSRIAVRPGAAAPAEYTMHLTASPLID